MKLEDLGAWLSARPNSVSRISWVAGVGYSAVLIDGNGRQHHGCGSSLERACRIALDEAERFDRARGAGTMKMGVIGRGRIGK